MGGINTVAKGGSAYFDTTAFLQPTGIRLGTSGRNSASGPGYFNLDGSIFKIISINEKIKMEIRGEAFSVTNPRSLQQSGYERLGCELRLHHGCRRRSWFAAWREAELLKTLAADERR